LKDISDNIGTQTNNGQLELEVIIVTKMQLGRLFLQPIAEFELLSHPNLNCMAVTA
jgi:hypothetical protein